MLSSQSSSLPDYNHPLPIGPAYTALENGWIYAYVDADAGNGYFRTRVYVNGTVAIEQTGSDEAGHGSIIPVSAGDFSAASAHVTNIVCFPCIK